MDEIVDALDLVGDLGSDVVVEWALRLVGFAILSVGLGLWLLADVPFLFVPAVLVGVGLVFILAPRFLASILELAG